jgi:hypothetical protein
MAVTEAAFLIAMLLGRPTGLVTTVYEMAGLEGVCVVEYESHFNTRAWRREAAGGTSFGAWQLYDKFHPQYRDDLLLHLAYGAEFWKKCMEKGGTVARAYSIWNSGNTWTSIKKGKEVDRKVNSLAMYLYRHFR